MMKTRIDAEHLRFCATRLSTLLYSLEVAAMEQFSPISAVADFATLVGTYDKGFILLWEPAQDSSQQGTFEFACLDASIAMAPVLKKFRSVIITSGTLSPLNFYPKLLNFQPVLSHRFPMTLQRACVCPLVVTRGSDQLPISTRYEVRNDPAVIRNYGYLLLEIIPHVPDGIVCFFPSYRYLEVVLSMWNDMGLVPGILKHKLLFVETTDALESSIALQHYRQSCDNGRGAVLLCVARGKVSEGVDFDRHYGRCVIVFGIPFVYTEGRTIKARLEFLRDEYQIREGDFLTFDAMRNAAQCVGRVIRGKDDYGILIFADNRYARSDKRSKLPQWISQYMTSSNINLSTEEAVTISRHFLKNMAQPLQQEAQMGSALWALRKVVEQPASQKGRATYLAYEAALQSTHKGGDVQNDISSVSRVVEQ